MSTIISLWPDADCSVPSSLTAFSTAGPLRSTVRCVTRPFLNGLASPIERITIPSPTAPERPRSATIAKNQTVRGTARGRAGGAGASTAPTGGSTRASVPAPPPGSSTVSGTSRWSSRRVVVAVEPMQASRCVHIRHEMVACRNRTSSTSPARHLVPSRAVDALAQQVGVPVVPRVLLDHVQVDPPQVDLRAVAGQPDVVQAVPGGDGADGVQLCPEPREVVVRPCRVDVV